MASPSLSLVELCLRLGTALGCGAAIGAERQWRQRMAGLRRNRQENTARALLIQLVTVSPLSLQDGESAVGTEDKHTVIRATLAAHERADSQVEQITSRLTLERDIVGVSWRALPATTIE